ILPEGAPPIEPNPAGAAASGPTRSATSDGLRLKRKGLGRIALVSADLRDFAGAPASEQRRLLAFLWKMRQDRLSDFMSTGRLNFVSEALGPSAQAAPNERDLLLQMRPSGMRLAPLPLQTGDQLLGRLMPRNLRIVPVGLIALFLLVYIAVIGPGDYLLLGALKRRRYTWILFPAVTVAFALGTVTVSNWYMRVADNRRGVTILDVDDSGKIVRRNRFEVLFRGAPGEVSTDVTRGIHTAMNHQRFSSATWHNYQMAVNRGTENLLDLVAIPTHSGRVPGQYIVTQYLPQWTPQLNRQYFLSGADESLAFDWRSLASLPVSGGAMPLSPEVREKIASEVRQAAGASGSAYVVQGSAISHVAGKRGLLQRDDAKHDGNNVVAVPESPYNVVQNSRLTSFLQDICSASSQGGLFNIVSQISPTAGKDFEDLSLLDPSDPKQWLLVVVVERGDDLYVYRKLYAGEP
ncbi:MAG TPA: hypothetical protein VL475_09325, partial [Planctomycetaceae bacterium]|nr:hypothetical protein [Planctomycetaceae bacterium]